MEDKIELRIRTIRMLWLALFMSVGLYYSVTFFVPRSENAPNDTLFLVLLIVSIAIVRVSFNIKNSFLTRAEEQQRGSHEPPLRSHRGHCVINQGSGALAALKLEQPRAKSD